MDINNEVQMAEVYQGNEEEIVEQPHMIIMNVNEEDEVGELDHSEQHSPSPAHINGGPEEEEPLPEGFHRPANWRSIFPPSSLRPLKTPSLCARPFFWLYTTVPDTLIWMVVALVCFFGQCYEFSHTDTYKHQVAKGMRPIFSSIIVAAVVFILIVAYFYSVRPIRKMFTSCLPKVNPNATWCQVVSLGVVGLISSSYIWLGERNYYYVYLKFFVVIGLLIPVVVTLRPVTDFNVINGFFVSLMTHALRISFMPPPLDCTDQLAPAPASAKLPGSSFYPFIIIGLTALAAIVRCQCEALGVEADQAEEERKKAAATEAE